MRSAQKLAGLAAAAVCDRRPEARGSSVSKGKKHVRIELDHKTKRLNLMAVGRVARCPTTKRAGKRAGRSAVVRQGVAGLRAPKQAHI